MTGFQDSISFEQRITEQLLPHQGFARRLARGLLFDEHQADDVVQQAWLAALRTPPESNPRGWLTRVVRGRARDVHRERVRRDRRELAVARDEALPAADEVLAREDERRKVVDAVRALPDPYRQAIVLRYLEERSPKEIGEALGMPAATVRSHVKRGLERLRELLDEQHDGDRRGWMLALIPLAKPTALVKSAGLGTVPLAVAGSWWLWVMKKALWVVPLVLLGWLGTWILLDDDVAAGGVTGEGVAAMTVDSPGREQSAQEAAEQPGAETAQAGARRADAAERVAPDSITAAMAKLTGRVLQPGGAGAVVGARVLLTSMDSARLTAGMRVDGDDDASGMLQTEARTDEQGRFVFDRVWPGVTSFLRIEPPAVGASALRAHTELLDVTPAPGATVDLGEFRLAVGGSLRGRIVDEQGQPIGGALVWAAPLPTMLSNLMPWDSLSFHGDDPRLSFIAPMPRTTGPDGAVTADGLAAVRAFYGKMIGGRFLARGMDPTDSAHELAVIEVPRVVVRGLRGIGVSMTHSGADGSFTLAGLPSTEHVVVARQPGREGRHRGGIQVPPAGVRDIGAIKLRMGQTLRGVVRDAAGEPVVGAEVRIAPLGHRNYLGIGLVHAVHSTGSDGRFESRGLHRGRALVAVRRRVGLAWTVRVVSVRDDVAVSLPPEHSLEVEVARDDELVDPSEVELRVQRGPWLTELQAFDFGRRLQPEREVRDQSVHLGALPAGRYTIEVGAPGCVPSVVAVSVPRTEALRVRLQPAATRSVVVVDPEGRPVASATVLGRAQEVPPHRQRIRGDSMRVFSTRSGPEWQEAASARCRTDAAGRGRLEGLPAAACWVSVTHPAFVAVQVPVAADAEAVRVQLQRGGQLVGRVEVDRPEGWIVRLERKGGSEGGDLRPAGAMIARPAADQSFAFRLVPPGDYRVVAEPRKPQSIGLDQAFARAVYFDRPAVQRSIAIGEGQRSEVVLSPDRGEGRITGKLTIDGDAPGPGLQVGIQQARRDAPTYYSMQHDGSFEISGLAVKPSLLTFRRDHKTVIYSQSVDLVPEGATEVSIGLQTGALAGTVLLPDGSPAVGLTVHAHGSVGPKMQGSAEGTTATDATGKFVFDGLLAGLYTFDAARDGLAADIKAQRVTAGATVNCEPVRMARVFSVTGRVDTADGADRPIRIALQRDGFSTRFEPIAPSGVFGIDQVRPGSYRAQIMVQSGMMMSTRRLDDLIEVRTDRRGLVLKITR